MNRFLVLSILSDDRPGVVEALAKVVHTHHGNWLESKMSHLAGKFAGILHLSVAESSYESLCHALTELQQRKGIQMVIAESSERATRWPEAPTNLHFNLMGNDRPGIVQEVSQAFVNHGINLQELHTGCTSMPWSGTPMFTAHGLLQVPSSLDLQSLEEQLDRIADNLGVDIEIREPADSVTG